MTYYAYTSSIFVSGFIGTYVNVAEFIIWIEETITLSGNHQLDILAYNGNLVAYALND